jgi:hypothetical protein
MRKGVQQPLFQCQRAYRWKGHAVMLSDTKHSLLTSGTAVSVYEQLLVVSVVDSQ